MNKLILSVPSFQETLHAGMCGPASLKIVLDFYGIEKSEAELATLMKVDVELGTNAESIARAAQELGLQAEIRNECSFADIQTLLAEGTPPIVDWFTRGRTDYPDAAVSDGHYSVVAGLDDENVYLQDPETCTLRQISRNDFERVWFDFADLLVTPHNLIIRQLIAIRP